MLWHPPMKRWGHVPSPWAWVHCDCCNDEMIVEMLVSSPELAKTSSSHPLSLGTHTLGAQATMWECPQLFWRDHRGRDRSPDEPSFSKKKKCDLRHLRSSKLASHWITPSGPTQDHLEQKNCSAPRMGFPACETTTQVRKENTDSPRDAFSQSPPFLCHQR